MENPNYSALAGYTLLGLLAGVMILAVARGNDQKRLVGYDEARSLVAVCSPTKAAVFTNGERQAVFLEKTDGRVAAQPVFRGATVVDLDCDPYKGEIVVTTARGREHIAIASLRAESRALALTP